MRRSQPLEPPDLHSNPAAVTAEDETTYAAIIAITLPGTDSVAAHVVLSPRDQVETDRRVEQLSECTLDDIGSFADKLEAEVWETYRAIKLVDLDASDEANLEVTVEDKAGRTVMLQNWMHQAVILPEQASGTTPDEGAAGEEPLPVESAEAETSETDAVNEVAPVAAVGDDESTALEDSEAQVEQAPAQEPLTVTVSESEPVYEEREATDDPNAYPTPAVAPSRARVRIAGKRQALGHATWSAVDILVDEPALRSAQAHALSSPNREVAGVLLGPPPEKQPDGRYVVHIFDTILAKYTVMHGASVTYTPESWRYLNDKLAERYPDETAVMVGWYHTHPGFGIFLSGMDQFIHQNFFTQIWHIAMVLDPVTRSSGFFGWDRNQTRVARYDFDWPGWATGSW